ncbi:MAG: hypothetical protein OXI33_05635 [Chloroflexota bacterium]|nr:hypothetical protein [Chloroflexota bacterium]
MGNRDVQRARAAQLGLLMRSYRESFAPGDGQRGLTQEALLERMGRRTVTTRSAIATPRFRDGNPVAPAPLCNA